jgi:hypothetical protein
MRKEGCMSTQRGKHEEEVPKLKKNRYSAKGGYLVYRQKSYTKVNP